MKYKPILTDGHSHYTSDDIFNTEREAQAFAEDWFNETKKVLPKNTSTSIWSGWVATVKEVEE